MEMLRDSWKKISWHFLIKQYYNQVLVLQAGNKKQKRVRTHSEELYVTDNKTNKLTIHICFHD